jgi:hypothetical protein
MITQIQEAGHGIRQIPAILLAVRAGFFTWEELLANEILSVNGQRKNKCPPRSTSPKPL